MRGPIVERRVRGAVCSARAQRLCTQMPGVHRRVRRSKRGTRSAPRGWGCKELRKTNQEGSPSMHSKGAVAAGILFASSLSAPAWPAEFKITDDATFNAGIGFRPRYLRTDFCAPDGGSESNKFLGGGGRLFFRGWEPQECQAPPEPR